MFVALAVFDCPRISLLLIVCLFINSKHHSQFKQNYLFRLSQLYLVVDFLNERWTSWSAIVNVEFC